MSICPFGDMFCCVYVCMCICLYECCMSSRCISLSFAKRIWLSAKKEMRDMYYCLRRLRHCCPPDVSSKTMIPLPHPPKVRMRRRVSTRKQRSVPPSSPREVRGGGGLCEAVLSGRSVNSVGERSDSLFFPHQSMPAAPECRIRSYYVTGRDYILLRTSLFTFSAMTCVGKRAADCC